MNKQKLHRLIIEQESIDREILVLLPSPKERTDHYYRSKEVGIINNRTPTLLIDPDTQSKIDKLKKRTDKISEILRANWTLLNEVA